MITKEWLSVKISMTRKLYIERILVAAFAGGILFWGLFG